MTQADPLYVDISVADLMLRTHVYDCPGQVSLDCHSHTNDFIGLLSHHQLEQALKHKKNIPSKKLQPSCLYLQTDTMLESLTTVTVPPAPVARISLKANGTMLVNLDLSSCGLKPLTVSELSTAVNSMLHIRSIGPLVSLKLGRLDLVGNPGILSGDCDTLSSVVEELVLTDGQE